MSGKTTNVIQITDCHDEGDVCGGSAANKVRLAYRISGDRHGLNIGQVDIGGAVRFNTIDLGFKAADQYFSFLRLGGNRLQDCRQIFAFNVAPPRSVAGADDNARDLFVVGRFRDGSVFGSTQKGYALSYLKAEIAELHALLDSNNGSQFRSLDVLPEAIVQYAAGTMTPDRLQALAVADLIDPPAEAHVLAIDNFGNVKIHLSPAQRRSLADRLAADPRTKVLVGFGTASLEFEASTQPGEPLTVAWLADKMFSAAVGDQVLALNSSARLRVGDTLEPVAQLATICHRPDQPLGHPLPQIGAPVFLAVVD